MRRPFAEVDVFTEVPYFGNPVAVVLDAWFAGAPSPDESDRANVAHVDAIAGA